METTVKVLIVIMSHLSDAQELLNFDFANMVSKRVSVIKRDISNHINFAKYLAMRYEKDLTVEIDPDEEYRHYVDMWAECATIIPC